MASNRRRPWNAELVSRFGVGLGSGFDSVLKYIVVFAGNVIDAMLDAWPRPTIHQHFYISFCCWRYSHSHILLALNYTKNPKKLAHFVLYTLTSSNIDRFSNLFHCQNQKNVCNNATTRDPTTHQVCRYTTLWNVSVLKAATENKTTYKHILRVRRPAARRTHWTFDVKTAGRDSYTSDNNWDDKHVVSCW